MIDGLKPYPAMKESGVPWLAEVPEHWEVRRLGASVEGCINGVWGEEPNGVNDLPCVRVADFDRMRLRVRLDRPTLRAISASDRRRRLLQSGDLLLEKSGGGDLQPVGVVVLYDHPTNAVCSNFVARMPPAPGFDPSYLTYMHSHLYAIRLNVRSIKQTTGIQNLDSSLYLSEPVAFPPLPEQAAIVRFLDYVDRRIRRYIRAKQKLIKLLEEQKQAIIHRAVTRGLDPNVRLKPSGVEWLGDVPEHWDVKRLRYLIEGKLTYGANAAAEHTNPDWPRYLRITDFGIDGSLRAETFRSLPPDVARDHLVKPGDVLLARSGATVGKAFLVPPGLGEACHAGYLIRARPRRELVIPEYLFAFTQSTGFARWKDSTFIIATIQNIGADKYAGLPVPVPPLPEQADILHALTERTQRLRIASGGAMREIALLREYRTRLIADVVTGKLDVREAAARLPDEVEEPEPLDETEAEGDADDAGVGDADEMIEEAET